MQNYDDQLTDGDKYLEINITIDWLMFNVKWALFQLYIKDENNLTKINQYYLDEMWHCCKITGQLITRGEREYNGYTGGS